MVLAGSEQAAGVLRADEEPFPRDVDFLISAMEAGPQPVDDRRQHRRSQYRVWANFRLYSEGEGVPPRTLYTRHASPQAVGFVAPRHLPLSYGGVLTLRLPDGSLGQVACTVLRCREADPGWFEGALRFNREQECFVAE